MERESSQGGDVPPHAELLIAAGLTDGEIERNESLCVFLATQFYPDSLIIDPDQAANPVWGARQWGSDETAQCQQDSSEVFVHAVKHDTWLGLLAQLPDF